MHWPAGDALVLLFRSSRALPAVKEFVLRLLASDRDLAVELEESHCGDAQRTFLIAAGLFGSTGLWASF